MMLSGLADENIHAAVVAGLLRRGMDVLSVHDLGQRGADDEFLLTTATAQGRLIITNDSDFLRLHAEWSNCGRVHTGIIFWHAGKYGIGESIRRILDYAATEPNIAMNRVKYL